MIRMSKTTMSHLHTEDDPVLTTRDAARHLGVAVSTAQLWMESGAIPSWKTPGGHRRCRLSDVRRLIERAPSAPAAAVPMADSAAPLAPEFLPLDQPPYPVDQSESARLAALAATALVDSPPEHVFDRLTWLATQLTGCSMALVSLLTSERQWFKARIGVDVPETPRASAFCSHAVLGDELFVVEDARQDARFRDNPLVTGEPHIRFYAGVPVRDRAGHKLGTLCVLDSEPRTLSPEQQRGLLELGGLVTEEISRRD